VRITPSRIVDITADAAGSVQGESANTQPVANPAMGR
jgi:hypothetical protein